MEPLREDWRDVQTAVQRLTADGKKKEARDLVREFHRKLCKERRRFPRRAVTHHQQTELSRRPRQVIVDETQALVDRHRR